MADLEQVIGFDVGGALNGLSALDTRLSAVNGKIDALTGAMERFNKVGGIETGLKRISTAANQTARTVDVNVQKMTVSFGLLSRIVFTQTVVRSLRQLSSALSTAADDAINLDRQLGRTAAIDGFGRTVADLRQDVLGLSNQFNVPVAEVAAGQYELLQRNLKTTTEQIQIQDAALKFSKTLNVDYAASVNLIAGVLEAYHKPASEAASVSSQLFQTIRDGNISAKQLSTSLGPVASTAAQIGVELPELNAALVVMSNQGTNTATALTQLRGLFTGLLKPSQDLQNLLNSKGLDIASVKVLGLGGTLKILRDATKGNVAEQNALLRNVRALSGNLQLTGDGLDSYIEALTNQKAAQQGLLDQKFAEVMANSAEQVATAANVAKNVFTAEFGQAVIQIGQAFLDASGGAQKFSEAVGTAATVAGVFAKAIASPFIGAARVGQFFRQLADDVSGVSAREEKFAEIVKRAVADINAEEQRLAAQLKADQAAIEQYNKAFFDGTTKNRIAFNAATKEIASASKGLAAGVKSQLDRVRAAFQDVSNAAESVGTRINDIQADTRNAVSGLNADLDRIKVDRFLENAADPQQKFGILLRKSNDLLLEGTRELAAAGLNAEKRATAIAKLNLSREYIQQAAAIGKGSNDLNLQNSAQVALKQNAEGYRDALTGAEKSILKQQPELERMAQTLVGIGPQADEIIKKITDRIGLLKDNKFLSKDQLAQARKEIDDAVNDLVKLGAKVSPEFLRSLGFSGDKIAKVLAQVRVQAKEVPLNALVQQDALQKQLDGFFAQYRAKVSVDVVRLERVTKTKIENPTDLQNSVLNATSQLQKLDEQLAKISSKKTELSSIVKTFAQPLADELAKVPDLNRVRFLNGVSRTDDLRGIKADAQAVEAIFKKLSTPGGFTIANLDASDAAISAFLEKLKAAPAETQKAFEPFRRTLDLMKEGLLRGGKPAVQLVPDAEVQKLQQQKTELQNILNLVPQASQPLENGGAALTAGSNSLSLAVSASSTIATNLTSAAFALGSAVSLLQTASFAPSFDFATAHFGRPHMFAFGGHGRGTDKIHALIGQDESVINARSTQRFFSQIQTLNSGQVPVFHSTSRSSGPGDTNVDVGGITVNGANKPTNELAREIANQIVRLKRMGRVKRK